MKKEDIEELEELARTFIIGYEPLTKKQVEILASISNIETELHKRAIKTKQLERILQTLYNQLLEGKP